MTKKPLNCKTLHISFLVNLDVLVGWKRVKLERNMLIYHISANP